MKIKPETTYEKEVIQACRNADWVQVVGNGGPPCFHLEDGRFCLRAERWDGHKTIGGSEPIHEYLTLEDLAAELLAKRREK